MLACSLIFSLPDHDHSHEHESQGLVSEEQVHRESSLPKLITVLFGLSFHSIFVGIALGIQSSDVALLIAITFHQFFEGIALGARTTNTKLVKRWKTVLSEVIFMFTLPTGVIVGILVARASRHDPFNFALVNGTFQAVSAGVLLYVGMVHMLKEELAKEEFKRIHHLKLVLYLGVIVGSSVMAVIGIWA
jgi:zinc transporter 1/2/3